MRGSRCIKKFMNISGFSEPQREAFLDLLVLGMYSDHKLTLAEDASVQSVLDGFRCESDYERNKYLDAATARVREKARTEDAARAYAVGLAQKFKSPEHQRRASPQDWSSLPPWGRRGCVSRESRETAAPRPPVATRSGRL